MNFLTNINIIFYLVAYFVGGIPFGLLLTKIFFNIDIRKIGSGSIGATNVYRALKNIDPKKAKIFSILTIFLDALKGFFVVLVAMIMGVETATLWAVAVLSVVGHCFSPYLNFTGGKGVATSIGSIILLIPYAGIFGLFIWFLSGKLLKISSISSLLGVLSGIGASFFIYRDITHIPVIIIGVIIFYQHISNIIRLFHGEEDKVINPDK